MLLMIMEIIFIMMIGRSYCLHQTEVYKNIIITYYYCFVHKHPPEIEIVISEHLLSLNE
jgi:hypothetical protein